MKYNVYNKLKRFQFFENIFNFVIDLSEFYDNIKIDNKTCIFLRIVIYKLKGGYKMNKKYWSRLLFGMGSSLVLVLAACGGGGDAGEESNDEDGGDSAKVEPDEDGVYNYEDFSKSVSNTGEPSGTGTLKVGYTSDTPFEGTLNWAFYQGAPDAKMIEHFDEAVFSMNEDFQYTQDGLLGYELNEDDNTVTFTLQEDAKWHDGEPVTIEDYVASYEVIGHPDYDGVRGSDDGFTLIEGYEEYQSGDADEISGIEVKDDKTAVFHYKELAPSLTAGGFWAYLFPEHYYEGVEVKDMSASDQTRKNPIGIGPYKVKSITSGEAIVLEKFEDYWRGEPGMDGIEIKVIPSSSVADAVEKGDIDVALSFPTDQFPDVSEIDGVEWLGQIDGAYSYIGFKLGEWDDEKNEVNYKPDEMKMGDKELRRAMWHAVDNDAVGKKFYKGLRWEGTSLITPYHKDWHKDDLETPKFDPEKAKQILADAGYEDKDGDGFVETPDGEELVINFASMSGGDTAEPLANYYIQSWKDVGLNVEKTNGRLIEFNSFYDMLKNDDKEVDVYMGAWGVASDVDPSGLYGRKAQFNYPRYASEENDDLLKKGNSQEALDTEYRKSVYDEWQELMVEEIPVFPTNYRAYVTPVNERVKNWSEEYGYNEDTLLYKIGVDEE